MYSDVDLSSSLQDYLEKILELDEQGRGVRVTDIAKKMQIAKASVNQTVSKLKQQGLVLQESYGPVILTDSGRELANKTRRRHDRLRQFLIEVLKVDQDVAERDACKMEHAVSAQTMEKLSEFLCSNGYINDDCKIVK